MVGPMNVAGHDTGDDDTGYSEPRVSRKELKTAAELSGMIERDLAQHPDCPENGFRVATAAPLSANAPTRVNFAFFFFLFPALGLRRSIRIVTRAASERV